MINEIPKKIPTLYVGDLDKEVNEAVLYETFSKFTPVHSVRICRDINTNQSLGYGYINFPTLEAATSVIEMQNYEKINGKPVRLMWSDRNPALRRSGLGNIYIKNLDLSIDSAALHATMEQFGEVLSCKVQTNQYGMSLGYGFIHFANPEIADLAISTVNGMLIKGKQVTLCKFVHRSNKPKIYQDNGDKNAPTVSSRDADNFKNLFIKNFADLITVEELRNMMKPFGKIVSCVIQTNSEGKSKGFGFCSYETHESAKQAITALHNTEIKGKRIYVGKALKKAELMMLRQRGRRYPGLNLYIKNLDPCVTDADLLKVFSKYGPISSSKVMVDANGQSKGFGFVNFCFPEDGYYVLNNAGPIKIYTKIAFINIHQTKEQRKATRINITTPLIPYNPIIAHAGAAFIHSHTHPQIQPQFVRRPSRLENVVSDFKMFPFM